MVVGVLVGSGVGSSSVGVVVGVLVGSGVGSSSVGVGVAVGVAVGVIGDGMTHQKLHSSLGLLISTGVPSSLSRIATTFHL